MNFGFFTLGGSKLQLKKNPDTSIVSTMVMWYSNQWLCAEYWLKEVRESMERGIVRRYITEILLKTALNTIQSINPFGQVFFFPIA